MARKKKPRPWKKRLERAVNTLSRKFSPDVIQAELARVYGEYAVAAKTEPEGEFWFKCNRASLNLASGMNKWAHDMVEDLAEGELSDE